MRVGGLELPGLKTEHGMYGVEVRQINKMLGCRPSTIVDELYSKLTTDEWHYTSMRVELNGKRVNVLALDDVERILSSQKVNCAKAQRSLRDSLREYGERECVNVSYAKYQALLLNISGSSDVNWCESFLIRQIDKGMTPAVAVSLLRKYK